MQTENTTKRGNLTLILCAIIAVMAIIIWFGNCSGKGDGSVVIDTKEVKGGFLTVQGKDIEAKDIPIAPVVDQKVSGQKVSNATPKEVEDFKNKYKLTQKQYDSLLVVNRRLDSLANSLYDKRLQPIIEACKFVEFKHELDNDTIHITLTGISRGVPQNLDLQYLLKSRKDTIQLKQMWCRVFAGAEVGINKELNQGTYKLNLTIQNAKNDLLSASYQRILNENFYLVGYSKALFTINKRQKKEAKR
jgi:hypothetical protein